MRHRFKAAALVVRAGAWMLRHPRQSSLVLIVLNSDGRTLIERLRTWQVTATDDTLYLADTTRRFAYYIRGHAKGVMDDETSLVWQRHGSDLHTLVSSLDDLDAALRDVAADPAAEGRAFIAIASFAANYERVLSLVDLERLPGRH